MGAALPHNGGLEPASDVEAQGAGDHRSQNAEAVLASDQGRIIDEAEIRRKAFRFGFDGFGLGLQDVGRSLGGIGRGRGAGFGGIRGQRGRSGGRGLGSAPRAIVGRRGRGRLGCRIGSRGRNGRSGGWDGGLGGGTGGIGNRGLGFLRLGPGCFHRVLDGLGWRGRFRSGARKLRRLLGIRLGRESARQNKQ